MVGYQGLSSRASSYRQSGATGRATHTGTPSAPARCDGSIGGDDQVEVAQDRGGDEEVIELGADVGDGEADGDRGELVTAWGLLQAEEPDPRDAGQGGEVEQGDRAEAVPWMVGTALPGDADLQTADGAELLAPPVDRSGLGEQVGDLGRIVARVVPNSPGRLISGAWTSNSGSGSPGATTAVTPGQLARTRVNGCGQATITRPPRCTTRGAKRMNWSPSPSLCSWRSRMVRPPSGEPSQAGWRNEGVENPWHFQRHSYSAHPCSNRPIRSEAIPRFLCASA